MSTTATAPARAAAPSPRRGWYSRFRQRIFRVDPTDLDPVVLRHSRIYILPTPRGLAFVATLAVTLVTSLNYALSLGFAVTFLLGGLVAAALMQAFRNMAGLELRPLAAGETFAGTPLPFALAADGRGAARTAIAITAGGSAPVTVDVAASGVTAIRIDMPTAARGRLALGRVTLSSDYPLGLWRSWAYVHFPLAGIVYPAPEANAPPLPQSGDGDDVAAAARGDDADLAGLRPYRPGDPPQRIAWKAVARGAGWHTKTFEGAGAGGPVELKWRALPAALPAEARISRLTAWVLAAEHAARPFALQAPGVAVPQGKGREHRRAALAALALCRVEDR